MAKGRDVIVNIIGRYTGGAAFKKAQSDLKGFGPLGSKASSVLDRLGVSGLTAGSGVGVAGAAVAGATAAFGAAFAVVQKSVDAYTSLADKVRAFVAVSGASTEEASRFIALGDDYSVAAETMSKAVFILSDNIEKNSTKLAENGVTAARAADGSVDLTGTLMNVAEAYQAATDAQTKNDILTEAFGKRLGAQLIPILNRTRAEMEAAFQGAEQFGQIMTPADLKRAQEFKLAMDDLADSGQEVFLAIGEAVIPTLTELANDFVDATENVEDFAASHSGLVSALKKVAAVAIVVFVPIVQAYEALKALGFFSNEAADKARDLNHAMNEAKQKAQGEADAIEDLSDAHRDYERSILSVGDATDALTEKQKAYDDIVAGQGPLVQEAVDATKDLARARDDAADAAKDTVRAEEGVTEARATLQQSTEELHDAEADLAELRATEAERAARAVEKAELGSAKAADAVADAKREQADAQKEYDRAVASGQSPDRIAGALEKLTDATLAVRDASLDNKDAGDELKDARKQQQQGTDELHDAEKRVEDQHKAVVEAEKSVKDAVDGVTDAREQQADAVAAVAEAQKKVNDAEKAAKDPKVQASAARDLKDAELDLADAIDKRAAAQERLNAANTAATPPQDFPEIDAERAAAIGADLGAQALITGRLPGAPSTSGQTGNPGKYASYVDQRVVIQSAFLSTPNLTNPELKDQADRLRRSNRRGLGGLNP